MPDPRTVIAVNYHRIGPTDPANPYHRLHAVPEDSFAAQLDLMQSLGKIVSPDQVRRCQDLASVNFVLCFDDVPLSALTGITIALERGLPVTISVCGQLATDGHGTRDLVYAIEKYLPPAAIEAHVRSRLPGALRHGDLPSFYQLTKSADLHPAFVRSELIGPLFKTLPAPARCLPCRARLPVVAASQADRSRSPGDHGQPHPRPRQPRRAAHSGTTARDPGLA